MRVKVTHSIGDLARDLAAMPPHVVAEGARIVARNAREGNRLAQRFDRESAGPHGAHHFKRLSAESLGALEWEYGFEGDIQRSVGGGFRHGPPNTDLARSADIFGPKLAEDVSDMVDGLFW